MQAYNINSFLKFLKEIQDYITHNNFYGIPLDIIAHLYVAILLTHGLRLLKVRFKIITLIVLIIAFGKEILDYNLKPHMSFLESTKDIVVTITYPAFFWIREKIKKLKLSL